MSDAPETRLHGMMYRHTADGHLYRWDAPSGAWIDFGKVGPTTEQERIAIAQETKSERADTEQ